MRLFLIRHGETVDNVAGLYAGSRDSQLTNHGFQQAGRLGQHFRDTGIRFTHIFSSPLQRAHKTAERIRDAQQDGASAASPKTTQPEFISSPLLKEQDLGFYEGKMWQERPHASSKKVKQAQLEAHKRLPGFVDVESKESMAERTDAFLREQMVDLWKSDTHVQEHVVAVVSHGIILSVLWRRLLRHLPAMSVSLLPELASSRAPVALEYIGGFSNTGYLELAMVKAKGDSPKLEGKMLQGSPSDSSKPTPANSADSREQPQSPEGMSVEAVEQIGQIAEAEGLLDVLRVWTTTIRVINGKEHLKNLKRTGGGVGNSTYDEGQKTIESFFKRRKVD